VIGIHIQFLPSPIIYPYISPFVPAAIQNDKSFLASVPAKQLTDISAINALSVGGLPIFFGYPRYVAVNLVLGKMVNQEPQL
jgi:hypothetical protein